MKAAIVCSDLSFAWADGTPVLDHLDVAFDAGRTGLIGVNGSGKSTFLRLVAGELRPTGGTMSVDGDVGYLPQAMPLDTDRSVSQLLGIAETRAALDAIERGEATESNFATVGEDWDIDDRARAQLAQLGVTVGDDVLDRHIATLSGGEAALVGLAALRLRRPAVTMLDEPTNNLDRSARERLYAAVESWPGVMIVVSHDRELLDLMDQIAELRAGSVRTYGGTFTEYQEQLAIEQESAQRQVRASQAAVDREQRQLIEARTKLDRRARYGQKDSAEKRKPKIVLNQRKRDAQVSAGKHRIMQTEKVERARQKLDQAERAVRDDDRIRVDLPRTAVPAGRTVLEIDHNDGRLTIRGPERVALTGPNGSGKTTLLRAVAGTPGDGTVPGGAVVQATVGAVGYLPQRLGMLDDERSVLDNVREAVPSATPHEVRAGLARFLIRGAQVEQPTGTLSGGERFRVVLARLLLADPPPQLLLLDEPTNNLDLASVEQLQDALAAYRGALLVASHDLPFLRSVGITTWWSIDRARGGGDRARPVRLLSA